MNSRHPDPWFVRTGGPEQQSADGIRGIRRDPGMGSFFNFLLQKSMVCGSDLRHSHLKRNFSPLMCNPLAVSWPQNALARCFFDFFGDVLHGSLGFRGHCPDFIFFPIFLVTFLVTILVTFLVTYGAREANSLL